MGRARLNGQSGGAKINGIIEEYVVQAGSTISAGDFVQFVTDTTAGSTDVLASKFGSTLKAELLTDTLLLVIYLDFSNSYYGCAKAISISNGMITSIGNEFVFYSGTVVTNKLGLSRLTDTTALVTFKVGSYNLYSVILSVSGTTITKGTQVTTFNAGADSLYLAGQVSQTNTSVFITFNYNSSSYAIVLTISGTTITVGTPTVVNATGKAGIYWDVLAISGSVVIGVGTYSTSACAVIFTISGTTITMGTAVVICTNASGFAYYQMIKISSSQVLLAFNSANMYIQVSTISGTAITFATEQILTTSYYNYPVRFVKISGNKYLLVHSYDNNGHHAYTVLDRFDSSFVKGITYNWLTTMNGNYVVPFIIGSKLLNIFSDSTNTRVVNVYLNLNKYIKNNYDRSLIQGVAKSKGVTGETVKVYTLA